VTAPFRACAVVPVYDHAAPLRGVVERLHHDFDVVFVVDDGSGTAVRDVCDALASEGLARIMRHETNRGKGAAVKTGLAEALREGFTHALQVDADGQHDLTRVAAFLEAGRANPDALVLAEPIYDDTAPTARRVARRITTFWVALEVGSRTLVKDAMIGFRLYPVAATLAAGVRGDRMTFDIEIVVRMARAGTPIVNRPVNVRYFRAEDGGVSHIRPWRDNLAFSLMHTRLCIVGCVSAVTRLFVGGRR